MQEKGGNEEDDREREKLVYHAETRVLRNNQNVAVTISNVYIFYSKSYGKKIETSCKWKAY